MEASMNRNTLAYHFGVRPGVQHRDMSTANTHAVATQVRKVLAEGLHTVLGRSTQIPAKGNPEVDALVFYMLNHAMALIRSRVHPHADLGDFLPLVEEYHSKLAALSTRMFCYLLLICTRESRHDKSGHSKKPAVAEKFGPAITNFHKSLYGQSSHGAADKFVTEAPHDRLGKYTEFLVDVFYNGTYSSGYGGKAWGAVADVLHKFVTGEFTAEMMMDTAFTLCHNNGPIFNKGMLFESYSDAIYKILDVQRSGQIPQLVGTKGVSTASKLEVLALWETCHAVLPADFSGDVDWYKVESLGALKKYPIEKAAQDKKNGSQGEVSKPAAQFQTTQPVIGEVEITPKIKLKKVKVRNV